MRCPFRTVVFMDITSKSHYSVSFQSNFPALLRNQATYNYQETLNLKCITSVTKACKNKEPEISSQPFHYSMPFFPCLFDENY